MPDQITLSITKGATEGKSFTFQEKDRVFIGRQEDCGIVIPENTVSRYHCVLEITPPEIRLQDFGSLNGTFLNGELIGRRERGQPTGENTSAAGAEYPLRDGDVLGLGKRCELKVSVHLAERCADCGAEMPDTPPIYHDSDRKPICADCHARREEERRKKEEDERRKKQAEEKRRRDQEAAKRQEEAEKQQAAEQPKCAGCGRPFTPKRPDNTQSADEALKLAGEKDIRLCLLDAAEPSRDSLVAEPTATVYESENGLMMSQGAFDYAPMAAGALRDGSRLFRSLRERLPDLPIYLLETESFPIDPELLVSFVRAGARGKLECPKGGFSVMEDELSAICRDLYLQSTAARLAAERRALYFETAPRLSEDGKEIVVRLRSFSLKRTTSADDVGNVLDDVEKPNVRFSDVVGAGDAKDELRFFIDYLKNPKRFTAQGLKPPKGVLLYGPPGTGKTMLAKAMAGESSVAFIPAAASTFVTKYQGSGPESVRELFQKARRYAPSILFIDEIDAVGRKRGQSNTAHGEEMALNALLTEMDGFSVDPRRPVFVLAATNFDVDEGQGGLGVIDAALARRFDRKILVDLPNEKERELFIRLTLQKDSSHVVTEDMIRRFASRSTGMSPANLASVLELAGRMAVKAQHPLDDAILDEAFEITRHGEKKDWGRDYLERVARHESGHAFLCWLGGNTPSYLTIVARGGHGGYMEHSSADMGPLQTRDELLNRIRTSLGGRAAELAYYGEKDGISTGASGDLENATRIAQAMICNYGMDEKFGLAVLGREAASNPDVRCRVNELLREEMNRTVEIIRKNKPRIDRLVDALLEKNKLNGPEIEELLKEEASS